MRLYPYVYRKRPVIDRAFVSFVFFSLLFSFLLLVILTVGTPAQNNASNADYQRALAKIEKKDFDGAISEFNKVIDTYQTGATRLRTASNAARATSAPDVSSAYTLAYENSVVMVSPAAAAYCGRGIAHYAKGEYDEALADFIQTTQLAPRYAEAYLNMGTVKHVTGDVEGAVEAYSKAIELRPGNAVAYFNRGTLYLNRKGYDRALEDFNQAIELNTKIDGAYLNRGNVWAAIGDYEQALKDYNRAIALNDKLASAYNNRGGILLHKREFEKAKADFDRAIQIAPAMATPYMNRGVAFLMMGKAAEASDDFSKSLALDPTLASSIEEYKEKVAAYQRARTQEERAMINVAARPNP